MWVIAANYEQLAIRTFTTYDASSSSAGDAPAPRALATRVSDAAFVIARRGDQPAMQLDDKTSLDDEANLNVVADRCGRRY